MDQRGSLVDTNLKIYPSEKFIAFIQTIPIDGAVPNNILRYIQDNDDVSENKVEDRISDTKVHFTDADIEVLNKIKNIVSNTDKEEIKNDEAKECVAEEPTELSMQDKSKENEENKNLINTESVGDSDSNVDHNKKFLTTSDIDWLYAHINVRKNKGEENVPFLHELFQGTHIDLPENKLIKRNPVLEARCVKLRAQQEAREYRKMTKGVDNVRMRFPEDSISYQLKQMNRQLIAIGQFVISIFAGFLFGFRGVEWMVGNLDFGVRLLLGVMCALIIALAEIYFLAKKLNEELTMTETVQLGGPPKFANQPDNRISNSIASTDSKEHQD